MESYREPNISIDKINRKSQAASIGCETTAGLVQDKGAGDSTSVAMLGDGFNLPGAKTLFPEYKMQSQVLADKKLLGSIFSFFNHNPSNSETIGLDTETEKPNMDLLNASLTCKRFFLPAMHVLWQSMESWTPLVNLIPKVNRKGGVYTAEGFIEKSDLRQLSFYSNLIEYFNFNVAAYGKEKRISDNLVLLLRQYLSSGLLPSLKILVISDFDSSSLSGPGSALYLLDFLIPQKSLSQLRITGLGLFKGNSAATILQIARQRSPMLTGLTLHGHCFGNAVYHTLEYFPNLERIDIDLNLWDSSIELDEEGPHFGALTDISLAGSVNTLDQFLTNLFSDAPLLEKLIISLKPGSKSVDDEGSHGLFELIRKLTIKKNLSLKTLVINSPSHDPGLQLCSSDPMMKYFGEPSWNNIKTLSIPLDKLSYQLIMSPIPSLERLTIEGGMPPCSENSSRSLAISAMPIFRSLFPSLKILAAPFSFLLCSNDIEDMEKTLTIEKSDEKCHGLEEVTLLPFADELPMDARPPFDAFNSTGIFDFPEFCCPTKNIADLFLISRFLNHSFPHLKKINVERLHEFVDEAWLNGLESGVQHFREAALRGSPKVCPRCHSPW